MEIKKVAELQKVYSQLFLDGHVDEHLYRSLCIGSTLHLLGVSSLQVEIMSWDMKGMEKSSESLSKLIESIRIKAKERKQKEANDERAEEGSLEEDV